jgi:hypothetical protein
VGTGAEWIFKRTHQFRKSLDALSPDDQKAAREAFKKFRMDPFDKSLRVHKINRLSSLRKQTVRSVVITERLRAVFTINGNVVLSEDIGHHDIYK